MERVLPKLGLLTGISYQSGLDYYKNINVQFMDLVCSEKVMKPNPELTMVSLNCDKYADMLMRKDWNGVSKYLMGGIRNLIDAKAQVLIICSNTAHLVVPDLRKQYPEIDVLHIADVTATAINAKGLTKVGLLGTEPTMREDFLKLQLQKHGLEVIVPSDDTELKRIFAFIRNELSVGLFENSTREFFVEQAHKLVSHGAQGIILGCTELELLFGEDDVPSVPIFPSAKLHIEAASSVAAGLKTAKDFEP